MFRAFILVLIGGLSFPAITLAETPDGAAATQSTSDEVLVGPVDYAQNVNGVNVNISAKSYLKIVTKDNKIYLHIRVLGDLFDLQQKIGQIVDTFSLPTDNCASYSLKNPVVSISRKELPYGDNSARFSISGSIAIWQCLENPVPNSKVEWEIRNIGFGIKTKVPVVKTWPGSPIKNKLLTQPFDADLPVRIVKNNDHSVGLQFSEPNIELNGQYVFITKGVLKIAGVDVNQKAYDALQKAIDPQKLTVALPDEILKFNPVIEGAGFTNPGGHLTANIEMSALIPPDAINELIKELLKKKKS